ncbi:unnamed protein product [Mytilus edulis]|uniref:Uncharacterized protein n=1 Tax=Mytilus edulis TaxID=6550 RepID=A0A8S3PTS5_MYTED|nr:unnamed protein product [Mytilus edulis]
MIEELERSIEHFTSKVKNNMTHIILGGNFNLPDINWHNTTVNTQPTPTVGKKFWQNINSRKKTVNISTSKNSAGTEVIDNKGKAVILNGQYDRRKDEYNAIPWRQKHKIHRETKSNKKWSKQTSSKAGHIKSHWARHDTNSNPKRGSRPNTTISDKHI